MKKFFGNIYIFVALLLSSLVAVPWNNFSVWGLDIDFLLILRNNEFKIKLGILIFIFIVSLIFLFVTRSEFKKNKKVTRVPSFAATVPLLTYGFAFLSHVTYVIYSNTNLALGIGMSNLNSILLIAGGALIVLSIIFIHLFIRSFKNVKNRGRLIYFILFSLYAGIFAAAAYLFRVYRTSNYTGMSAKYMALMIPIMLVLYIFHLIIVIKKSHEDSLESNINEEPLDEIIISENQEIASKTNRINDDLYQEVKVDPEFSKQNKQRSKPNSIEYYIEKPKMFKPLNPTFDKLVAHVREFPDVISKLEEDKITFYVARRPFLVLMNYGDYYRMAFRYELEEGIRLIIKYPTISKNKSTREELWFKANNYGDLPKEVIYKIVKNAYDVVSN